MIHSLIFKMKILLGISVVMAFSTACLLYDLYNSHIVATNNQNQLVNLQREVSSLQGQLWLFLEYQDNKSYNNLVNQQAKFSLGIEESNIPKPQIKKIKLLNTQLEELIEQDKKFQIVVKNSIRDSNSLMQRRALLNARYNMLIQNIHEHLATQQKRELLQTEKRTENTIIDITRVLALFFFAITAISYRLLRKFRTGSTAISEGIMKIKARDFSHRIECTNIDLEFSSLGEAFNTMSEELEQNVVTKSVLENEVNKQTLELKRQKVALEYLSGHDSLTGVMNRRSFEENLKAMISRAQRTGRIIGVLFIDLDKFKSINDNHGHRIGDQVLVKVAERLRENTRCTDLVSRYGGDEFVIGLDLLDDKESVLDKKTQLVSAIMRTVSIESTDYQVGASIGISYFPDDGDSYEQLINSADKAMYVAKNKKLDSALLKSYQVNNKVV
ncbi:GGDEF domain-containing protein [Vibrio kanaloae]|uniref:GGDEF domain-containing protein n=1 Tax=Vibrio kanaloae TaxID=170673 RepID=UPI001EFEB9A7|nr:GGDEF domain-containing protein [Vibrio kanaloae]MCG9557347.1 diguanylate cyclase [Vibrio kanaloae]